jgi:hypothetical protein
MLSVIDSLGKTPKHRKENKCKTDKWVVIKLRHAMQQRQL